MTCSAKDNIVFSLEGLDTFGEVAELCALWWEDSKFFKEFGVPYAPDMELFRDLYDMDMLIVLCGRLKNKLVAVYVATITPYQFNTDYTIASEIVWCVHPAHRGGGVMPALVQNIKATLKERGVSLASLAVPCTSDMRRVGEYLKSEGFIRMDMIMMTEVK